MLKGLTPDQFYSGQEGADASPPAICIPVESKFSTSPPTLTEFEEAVCEHWDNILSTTGPSETGAGLSEDKRMQAEQKKDRLCMVEHEVPMGITAKQYADSKTAEYCQQHGIEQTHGSPYLRENQTRVKGSHRSVQAMSRALLMTSGFDYKELRYVGHSEVSSVYLLHGPETDKVVKSGMVISSEKLDKPGRAVDCHTHPYCVVLLTNFTFLDVKPGRIHFPPEHVCMAAKSVQVGGCKLLPPGVTEPRTFKQALAEPDSVEWLEAVHHELYSLVRVKGALEMI
ncbi:hypothetical protein CYMTET_9792 [Cymbomonas tetramitiformis]|uniref:Uncharacterized protein n=1 Tax=Cymbomonas tetramitiformis TaxID=36881 RepID=A0AAE0GQY7_9CHLO|nr:hypothetical protein CYMTET_9792 [Cymbomonas tetramitiformis]